MTAPKIKPCPDCGDTDMAIYAYENGWQHVECDECYYLGPGEGSKLQAIRSHNAASVGRNPQGEDRAYGLRRNDERAVVSEASETPKEGPRMCLPGEE